jgi:hypothetical protein
MVAEGTVAFAIVSDSPYLLRWFGRQDSLPAIPNVEA